MIFSLRGITPEYYDVNLKDDKDKNNPWYKDSWENRLANMAADEHGLSKEEIINMPWDGGSCVTKLKDKIKFTDQNINLYEWHEDVKVESVDFISMGNG